MAALILKNVAFDSLATAFAWAKENKKQKKPDKLTDIFITSGVRPLQTVDDEMYVEGFNQKTVIRSCRIKNHCRMGADSWGKRKCKQKNEIITKRNYRKWCRMGGKRVVLHWHNHIHFQNESNITFKCMFVEKGYHISLPT